MVFNKQNITGRKMSIVYAILFVAILVIVIFHGKDITNLKTKILKSTQLYRPSRDLAMQNFGVDSAYYVRCDLYHEKNPELDGALVHLRDDGTEEVIAKDLDKKGLNIYECPLVFAKPKNGTKIFLADSILPNRSLIQYFDLNDGRFHDIKTVFPWHTTFIISPNQKYMIRLEEDFKEADYNESRSLAVIDLENDKTVEIPDSHLAKMYSYAATLDLPSPMGEATTPVGKLEWNGSSIQADVYASKDPLEYCGGSCFKRVPVLKRVVYIGGMGFDTVSP